MSCCATAVHVDLPAHHVLHHHRQCGEAIVGNAEGQKSFVEDVLALQTKLETMLRQAFFMQVRRLLLCGVLAAVNPVFCSVLALCLLWVVGCGLCGLWRYVI
jgi:hypothetical protein